MQDKYCMVLTTCADKKNAGRIAEDLVQQKLAACVQLSEIDSFYMWQGVAEHSPEIRLMIKTRSCLYERVEKKIIELHAYDVPQIVCVPITGGSAPYLEWMDEGTGRL